MSEHYPDNSSTIIERHPEWPPLQTTFWFSPHSNAVDMEGIRPLLQQTDVYLYEGNPALTEQLQTMSTDPYARVGQYIKNSEEEGGRPVKGSAWEPIMRGLYASGKVVGTIDLRPEEQHIGEAIDEPRKIPIEGSFDEALEDLEEILARKAGLQVQRESLMVGHFEEEMTRIFDEYPDLQNRESVKVLLSMGSYHTTLRHLLSAQGVKSDRVFSTMPYIHGYATEVERGLHRGRLPDRQQLAAAYIGELIQIATAHTLGDFLPQTRSDAIIQYARKITSRITGAEAEEIYTLYQGQSLTVDYFQDLLARKSLGRLPQSPGEMPNLPESPKQQETSNVSVFRRISRVIFRQADNA